MKKRYTQNELREYFYESLDMFNNFIESGITRENLKLIFFTKENAIKRYEEMCRDFPRHISEPYKTEGYFDDIAASAFVNGDRYGVLANADIDFPLGEVLQMYLHEIAHLFCAKNEIPGGSFFDKYCMGSGEEDGMMNAGYAIWRETVADIMADSAMSDYSTMSLAMAHENIMGLYDEISLKSAYSKRAMSLIIVYIMISKEVACTRDWNKAKSEIQNCCKFDDPMMLSILEMVSKKIHQQPLWEITPDFIVELGNRYCMILTHKALKAITIPK